MRRWPDYCTDGIKQEAKIKRRNATFRHSLFLVLLLTGNPHAASLEEAAQSYFDGRSEKALDLYRDLWIQNKSTEAALNAAFIASELGHFDESVRLLAETGLDAASDYKYSEKHLEELTQKNPKFTLGHYFLGKLYEDKGQTDSAITSYQRVLKEDSHFVEVRPFLASLFEKKNQIDDAWRQYARMAAADSQNARAREGMNRLASLTTKKPEEIVPPKKIPSHTRVVEVLGRDQLSKMRVGIGTTSGGEPSLKKSLVFRTSKPFVFFDPEENKEIRTVSALSTWTIRLDPTNAYAEIVDSSGGSVGRFQRTIIIRQKSSDPTTTIINSLAFAPNTSWGGLADKEIRGDIEIMVNRDRKSLVVVNHLSVEEYLYGVLAAEMPTHWPMEALKAQAVIARTQGLYRKGLHRKFGYDICDEQHCQVYTGVAVESKKVREAVDGTRGEYLTYNGKPAHTVFSSNCGGLTQTGGQAGWGEVKYWHSIFDGADSSSRPTSLAGLRRWLQQTPAVFCESSKYTWHPEFRWTRVVMADDLAAKISRKKNVGRLKQIRILQRNASGRVQKVQFIGTNDSLVLSKEHEIRKYLGLGSLRSTLFVMDTVFKDNMPESFIFFGGGWGHAVGFCQSGAAGRAESGQNYTDILESYFPSTKLRKL